MNYKSIILLFVSFINVASSEVFTFDRLFPTSIYEKSYEYASKMYYSIDKFDQSEKTDNIKNQFLELEWSFGLRLYVLVKKLDESGEVCSHIQDYLYLHSLVVEVSNKLKNLDVDDDYMVAIRVLLNTISSEMKSSLRKVSLKTHS